MQWLSRSFLLAVLICTSVVVRAQDTLPEREEQRPTRISDLRLHDSYTKVPGLGDEVPGINLSKSDPYVRIGDDPRFASRDLSDTAWISTDSLENLTAFPDTIYWVRYTLNVAHDMLGVPLLLNVRTASPVEVYLNGRTLFRSELPAGFVGDPGKPLTDSLMLFTFPITLLADSTTEVITLRVAHGQPTARPLLSLHTQDTPYLVQRALLHFGLFIGINLIIFLLALVLWSLDRKDVNWLLLALLTIVTALDTFCDLGDDKGLLGLPEGGIPVLSYIDGILLPWPAYLLIMVLWRLQGTPAPKKVRRYTIDAIIVSLCGAYFATFQVISEAKRGDIVIDASFDGEDFGLIIGVIIAGILFAIVMVKFAIALLRAGFRVLRTRGLGRWIGAGALVSSLASIVLALYARMADMPATSWLNTLSDYCTYVALPVSVAIYLAIRSAHHNRLVARQRDELDEEVKERTAELRTERDRSDALLLNILPAEVAEELKRTGAAEAKHFDQASVLFTDFKGFTTLSAQVSAGDLLQELNTCFKAFDDIIGSRGIEKIKTIGDAYMCVGGLPDPKTSAPIDVVHAALAMQAFMIARKKEREALDLPAFEMRVGIHTGPVVAGIVGVKKFQYDIWGDTVNTASRMESSGEVGHVNISGSTYELVKDDPSLLFTSRGKVQAKGKGEMEMYYVDMMMVQ